MLDDEALSKKYTGHEKGNYIQKSGQGSDLGKY